MRRHFVASLLLCTVAATAGGAICGEPSQKQPEPRAQETSAASPTILETAPAAPPTSPGKPTPVPADLAAAFDEFPLLWLGTSYDSDGDGIGDQELVAARPESESAFLNPKTGQQIRPAIRSFAFAYGRCKIAPHAQSCPVPITIIFYPAASAPVPDEVVLSDPTINLRGVAATEYNGGSLWFDIAGASFSIDVFADNEKERLSQAIRIAEQLVGANAKAAGITKDKPFPPPSAAVPAATSTPVAIPQLPMGAPQHSPLDE